MRILLLSLILACASAQSSFLPNIDRGSRFTEFAIEEDDEEVLAPTTVEDTEYDEDPLASLEPLPSRRTYVEEDDDVERSTFDLTPPELMDEEEQMDDDDSGSPRPRQQQQQQPTFRRTSFLESQESVAENYIDSFFRFPESRVGTINVELQSACTSKRPRTARWVDPDATFSESTVVGPDTVQLNAAMEPLVRLGTLLLSGSQSSGAALLGTLRMLAPLLVARRVLAYLGDIAYDWYMGRYLRKTYNKLEKDYWHFYQMAAILKSGARFFTQLFMSFAFGLFIQSMIGLQRYPCSVAGIEIAGSSSNSEGSILSCSALWMGTTLCGSFAMGKIISEWHEFFRLSVVPDSSVSTTTTTTRKRRHFLRPLSILEWMRDPDLVVKEVLRNTSKNLVLKPFNPEPLFFPITYAPIRALQLFAVLREMRTPVMNKVMRRLLVQQALFDEWHRVLIKERRVALGLCFLSLYAVSTFVLYWSVGSVSGLSALLMLPAVISSIVSIWMNIYVYLDRRDIKRRINEQVAEI